LTVESLNRLLRLRPIEVFDEGETARPSCFPIDREDHLRRRGDRTEVGTEVSLGGAIGQIADEQTDSQSNLS
jgi:hypothetical protein